jgi:spore maturation protein SpmB
LVTSWAANKVKIRLANRDKMMVATLVEAPAAILVAVVEVISEEGPVAILVEVVEAISVEAVEVTLAAEEVGISETGIFTVFL